MTCVGCPHFSVGRPSNRKERCEEVETVARTFIRFILEVVVATALVLALLRIGIRLMNSARRSRPGVSALGWALLFLTSGRMPPPPPPSQIEVDVAGKKDREASRDVGEL